MHRLICWNFLVYTYNVCMIRFEWDAQKAVANLRNHTVSFEEAQTVFYDEFAMQFFDEPHSSEEDRFVMLGMSSAARPLTVVHCVRESDDVIGLVSARKATRNESKYYEGLKQ